MLSAVSAGVFEMTRFQRRNYMVIEMNTLKFIVRSHRSRMAYYQPLFLSSGFKHTVNISLDGHTN